MNLPLLTYSLVICCVLMIAAGQLLFKLLGMQIEAGASVLEAKVMGVAFAAFATYGLATLLWVYVLRTLPLTKAYPFMALSFVLVPIGGVMFFSESVRLPYVLGLILIVAGVVLTGWSGTR